MLDASVASLGVVRALTTIECGAFQEVPGVAPICTKKKGVVALDGEDLRSLTQIRKGVCGPHKGNTRKP